MSEPIFARGYARLYDAMYATKDYARECDAVEAAMRSHGDGGTYRSILDLGCGTGSHDVVLARRGYEVTGVDLSADMVEIARHKAAEGGLRVEFAVSDMRTVDLGRTFDAVLIMFAVLGYQTGDDDVRAALRTAHRHLRPGGVLVLDVWNAETVLREGARDRLSVLERPGRQLIKASLRTLRPGTTVVDVRMRVWEIEGRTLTASADESHGMRAFAPRELERFLAEAGLTLRAFFAFPELERPLRDGTFDLGCAASR